MKDKKSSFSPSSSSSKECRICGDIACGINFNLITCMPCKAFFRRNALKRSNICCEFYNDCHITKNTRSYCSPCRLKKCLTLGMDPELIRRVSYTSIVSNSIQPSKLTDNKQIQLLTPVPLGLLQNDRSTLTFDEWSLLSNCIHAFEEQNPSIRIQCALNQLSSLPPKLRLKLSDTYNIVGQFFTGIQSLIERSPDLHSLTPDARRALTEHNLNPTGSVNGIFLCRELDLFNNPIFLNACNICYGVEYMIECVRTTARCDLNGSLIKIMLFVMTFSSNCAIVTFNDQEILTTMSSSIDLIRLQNVYVTMLWKYLVYLYGFKAAALRFSYLVKTIVDVTRMLVLMPKNETHDTMVESIIIETQRALLIKY